MKKWKKESETVIANKTKEQRDWERLIAGFGGGNKYIEYGANRTIFSQGNPADSVFYIRKGKVKISVTSVQGKEAIIAILSDGDFFGEGCLAGQHLRIASASAITDCSLSKIDQAWMSRMLHERQDVSELFASYLLSRNLRYEEDLVDRLFNSSEKRLARTLLLLTHLDKGRKSASMHPRINQEDLAHIVGTTRSRISHFMNRFRTMGFVDYSGYKGLSVNSGLLSVVCESLPCLLCSKLGTGVMPVTEKS